MSTRSRLYIDAVLATAFLLAYRPTVTGMSLHEWLSVALATIGLFHLALNWDWVVHTAKSFVARLRRMSAANLVVDGLLFGATVMVVLSGLTISRVIGPDVGLSPSAAPLWHRLHSLSAGAAVALFALHGALHWKWILKAVGGLLSETKGGTHEADAKTDRGRSGRGRNHSPRHVGRGDRRDRPYAERWS
jgi:hypothetical protein